MKWKETHIRQDYQVSDTGLVRRVKRSPNRYGKYAYLKGWNNNQGYPQVSIDRKAISLHRLVAIAHIPNPNNYPIVMHKDNDKENASVDNLMWGTVSMNTKQAYEDGLVKNHYTPFNKNK